MPTSTDKVPNTSATAASSGSDLNGQAVRNACVEVRERMRPIAAQLLGASDGDADTIVFAGGKVYLPGHEKDSVTFGEVTQRAYVERISLSATGYYRTPNIYFDARSGKGRPFHYYAYGGSIVEVEVNGLTASTACAAWILFRCGQISPEIDKGQSIGFVQGAGYDIEELVMNSKPVVDPCTLNLQDSLLRDIPSEFMFLYSQAPQGRDSSK